MSGRAPLPERWDYNERYSRDSRGGASGSRPRGDYRGRDEPVGRRRTPSPSREDRSYGGPSTSARYSYDDSARDSRPAPAAKGNYTGRSSAGRDSRSRDEERRSQNYSRDDDRHREIEQDRRRERERDREADRERDRDANRARERDRSSGDRFPNQRAPPPSKSEYGRNEDRQAGSAPARDGSSRRYWDSNASSNIATKRSKGKEPESPRSSQEDRSYDRQAGQSKKPRLDDTTAASRAVEKCVYRPTAMDAAGFPSLLCAFCQILLILLLGFSRVSSAAKTKGVYVRPEDRQAPKKVEDPPASTLPPKPRGLASLPIKPVNSAQNQSRSKHLEHDKALERRPRSPDPLPRRGRQVSPPHASQPPSRPQSPYYRDQQWRPRSPSPASTVRSGFHSARDGSFRQESYSDRYDHREIFEDGRYRSPDPRLRDSFSSNQKRQRSRSPVRPPSYVPGRRKSANGGDRYAAEPRYGEDVRQQPAYDQPPPSSWNEPPAPSWTDPPAERDPWQDYQPSTAPAAPTKQRPQPQQQWQPPEPQAPPFSDAPGYNPGYQPPKELLPGYDSTANGYQAHDQHAGQAQSYSSDSQLPPEPYPQYQAQPTNEYNIAQSFTPNAVADHAPPFMPPGIPLPPLGLVQPDINRQLSMGIRAPPPGPNKGAGGRFKPIAGFASGGGQAESLKRFFPDAEVSKTPEASLQTSTHIAPAADDVTVDADESPRPPPFSPHNQQFAKAGLPLPPHLAYPPAVQKNPSVAQATSQRELFQHSQSQETDNGARAHDLPTAQSPTSLGASNNAVASPSLSSVSMPASAAAASNLPARPNFKTPSPLPPFLPPKPNFTSKGSKEMGRPKSSLTEQEAGASKVGESALELAASVQLVSTAILPPRPDTKSQQDCETLIIGRSVEDSIDRIKAMHKDPSLSNSASPSGLVLEAASSAFDEPAKVSQPETPVQEIVTAIEGATPVPRTPVTRELYERIAQVGEGTYGKVYKAKNTETGTLVAMKRIRMESEKDGFPVTAVREIKLLQSLDHGNVVALHEMMVSKGYVYMVFEYVDHDLTGILHHPSISFSPANLKSLMQQLLIGLDYIHWRGVLHRDLKGSNILLSKYGEVKIADFGLAKFYAKNKDNDYTNRVITQWYKPPELLFGETVYGPDVDMWSAGCMMSTLHSTFSRLTLTFCQLHFPGALHQTTCLPRPRRNSPAGCNLQAHGHTVSRNVAKSRESALVRTRETQEGDRKQFPSRLWRVSPRRTNSDDCAA